MTALLALAVATFVSEDGACIVAGGLIAQGRLSALEGVVACALGILAGDIGLWAAGRTGARLMRLSPRGLEARLAQTSLAMADWLRRNAAGAIVASRFLPGTRLPLYVTSGAIGVPISTFALWAAIASSMWTPLLVLSAAGLAGGGWRLASASGFMASVWSYAAGAIVLPIFVLVRVAVVPSMRRRAMVRLARVVRWEFWPSWLVYAPVALWIAMLAIRYRGLSTLTAANPSIPDGGTVGESKFEILQRLPAQWVIPSVLVKPARVTERTADLRSQVEAEGWPLPIVLKPDVGQRGVGVRLIRTWPEAEGYLADVAGAVLAQPYHPGPFEAGVFYYRLPHWRRGRVMSITDKIFPELVGDGVSTIEELIWQHPRYRLQVHTFLERHRASSTWVLAAGERFRLTIAGNHAQGTTFRNGAHLLTPALEARIDEIAQHRPGFFIGRFDVRYRDVDAFKAGTDLAIVELNGVTAEPTSIYDPDGSLWSAYRMLFRQWSLVFAIGAANRRNGAAVSSVARLAGLVRTHLTSRVAYTLSD